ncbi:YitT family protein [Novosphingobium album (ex Hu et al. 2023)]|uniref:YitT family protein n=1 Tax=Novosphingobium album (ex Hu et al. 2023) TaxID=2930093 RepID=A0ABT0AZG2_9SPHN|nr:YitT family protein [Novosphingobium album (ex Hu et al. 2023)]MCJ2178160.1 YitT family protein [Novosphingobium album (ex Hu et al. 2023)]
MSAEPVSPAEQPAEPAPGVPHTNLEDAYALFVGTVQLSLGLVLLKAGGLVTGGVAGISLVLNYLTGLPVGLFYTALTLPLLAITLRAMSWLFIVKTVIVTLGLFAMTAIAAQTIDIDWISRPVAALAGGSVIGMGALALARHGAGTGGSGAVVLWLYRTRGWNAGRTQLLIDGCVLLFSLVALDVTRVLWSLLGVMATGGILYVWHRPGRYTGY